MIYRHRYFFWSLCCLASVATESRVHAKLIEDATTLNDDLRFSEAEFTQRLRLLEGKITESQQQLKEKARIFHSLNNGASSPQFAWQAENHTSAKRGRMQELVKISMRENIREIESLQEQRKELSAEKDWLQIQMSELLKIQAKTDSQPPRASKTAFHCLAMPLNATLVQDFGSKKDQETGLEWRSLGWWFTNAGSEVRSCANGQVVYSGNVNGRGRVLMVDHGQGVMTLYANLSEEGPEARFHKGDRVKGGQLLGSPRERFYFEVRQNGVAVNPRVVLSTQNLSNLRIQGL